MSDNKQRIRTYLNSVSGRPKKAEALAEMITDRELLEHIAQVEAAFPEYELIVDDMIAEGDRVVVRGTFRGVHRGPFAGMQPTGKTVSAGLIIIYRLENGRVAEHWLQLDMLSVLRQLQETATSA
jgi:predicted ester cyclase